MHDELLTARRAACDGIRAVSGDLTTSDVCGQRERTGTMCPDVVGFGETPMEMDRIIDRLRLCDLFVSIGTSGHVYPAAGFVEIARQAGAHTVGLNLDQSDVADAFEEAIRGRATFTVPTFVEKLLSTER